MSFQESKDYTHFYTNKLAKNVPLGGPFIYCHLVRRLKFVLLFVNYLLLVLWYQQFEKILLGTGCSLSDFHKLF